MGVVTPVPLRAPIIENVDILIVDDEASLRDFLEIVFQEDGWRVQTAATLAEARQSLQKSEPDLVLCDLMVPDGSGIDLLREIKEKSPSVALIMTLAASLCPLYRFHRYDLGVFRR